MVSVYCQFISSVPMGSLYDQYQWSVCIVSLYPRFLWVVSMISTNGQCVLSVYIKDRKIAKNSNLIMLTL